MSDSADFSRYLSNPLMFPDKFKSWLLDYFSTNIPKIPISQVFGFKVQSVKSADASVSIFANSGASSATFTDMGAPSLQNVPNGFYIAFFGGAAYGLTANLPQHGLSVDGATPTSDATIIFNSPQYGVHSGRVTLIDMSQGTGAHSVVPVFKFYGSRQPYLHLLKVVTDT